MSRAQRQFEETLRDAIAGALHQVKAHHLPAACEKLGLASGTGDEAFASKFRYVKTRIKAFNESALLDLARRVLEEHDDAKLQDLLSEHELPADQRMSELTRRAVLKVLDRLDELFGDLGRDNLRDRLDVLAPSWGAMSNEWVSGGDDFERHYLRNDDWSHFELLEKCGALICAQERFVALINSVLRPEARTGDAQRELAQALDGVLRSDGFEVRATHYISGHPIYQVARRSAGVAGSPKNLIFASTGAKPEIVLRDAINNDVEITRHADLCLIYDRPLSHAAGLTWRELAQWWQDRESLSDLVAARKALGERLRQSLPPDSPGEYALFRTYFEECGPVLGEALPALIPQVYLHYDPLTVRERGAHPVLARQRMDFLMLLPAGVRVVLEVDGQHHYADNGRASPSRYADMIAEDRRLRLKGYELYRFGGSEFADSTPTLAVGPDSRRIAKAFFEALFARHKLTSPSRL